MNTTSLNSKQIARFCGVSSGLVAGITFAMVFGNSCPASAQTITPPQTSPITLNYAFTVPLAKAVPNPCTGGFVLMNGNLNVAISTIQGGADVYFKISGTFNSSGTGQDALATGALILNGSSNYVYTSEAAIESGFPTERPGTFIADLSLRDYLSRESGDMSDAFMMRTVLTLSFTNGVPALPVLQEIGVSCRQ